MPDRPTPRSSRLGLHAPRPQDAPPPVRAAASAPAAIRLPLPPMRPLPPVRVRRRTAAPPSVLVAGLAVGLVAANTVPLDRPGIGWLTAGLAVTAGVATVGRTRARVAPEPRARIGWTALALALLAVGTFRAAGWLFALCAIGACVAGSLAVFRSRSAGQLLVGLVAVPLTALRDLPWLGRGVLALRGHGGTRPARIALSAVVGVVLLVVFGALFAGADATFARQLTQVLPTIRFSWVLVLVVVGLCTAAAGHLLLAPAPVPPARSRRTLRRADWVVPVGLLVLLFAVFVADQLAALFGGAGYVLRTAGLTYAQYARSGFWQLLAVTALTLVVIAVAARMADRSTGTDRAWLRALLGALAGLTLVIVCSALVRMWSYQQAYSFTVLRLVVGLTELWLGVIYLLVIVAGTRLSWLPRTAVATGLAGLLALALVNPERLIVHENVVRWQHTGTIDLTYLGTLSPDAVAGLAGLPERLRECVSDDIAVHQPAPAGGWQSWNASRPPTVSDVDELNCLP
jgi:hypothetical protein